MNPNQRIKLTDTNLDVFHKVSEGNPGALRVCLELAVLRAQQLGFISDREIVNGCAAVPASLTLPPETLLEKVQERLPTFAVGHEQTTGPSNGCQ